MVDVLQGHPAVTLVMSAAQLVDGQSRLVRVRNRFGASGDCDGKQLIVRCFSQERANLIGEPSLALFRKSQAARGFDEGFRQLLDLEMWFHLLEQGRFGFIAEPLCAFRQHPAQHTELNARTGAAADEHLRLFERYYARPWMRQLATPRMLFMRMYYLREHYGDAAAPVLAQMSKSLGSSRYAAHLFAYKLSLRLRKFQRSLRKRGLLPRSLESLAAEP